MQLVLHAALGPNQGFQLPNVLWKCVARSVLIQDSLKELNEVVYNVHVNLKLFRLPFISNLIQLQSCLPEMIYKYFHNRK